MTCEFLEDIYIKQKEALTKHKSMRGVFCKFAPLSILVADTDDPTYAPKRKVLSGAFFKSKIQGMTNMVKKVTLDECEKLRNGSLEVDIM